MAAEQEIDLSDLTDEERELWKNAFGDKEKAESDAGEENSEAESGDDVPEESADDAAEEEQPASEVEEQVADVPRGNVTDLQSAYEAANAELDKLSVQFDDGEISARELRERSKPYERKIREIEIKAAQADFQRQADQADFEKNAISFLSEHPEYHHSKSPTLYAALDAEIKRLANAPENVNKPNAWFFQQADKNIKAVFGASGKSDDAKPEKQKAPPPPTPSKKPAAPPTLGNLPADAQNDESSESERILNMPSDDLEAYLKKLTPAQLDKLVSTVR